MSPGQRRMQTFMAIHILSCAQCSGWPRRAQIRNTLNGIEWQPFPPGAVLIAGSSTTRPAGSYSEIQHQIGPVGHGLARRLFVMGNNGGIPLNAEWLVNSHWAPVHSSHTDNTLAANSQRHQGSAPTCACM